MDNKYESETSDGEDSIRSSTMISENNTQKSSLPRSNDDASSAERQRQPKTLTPPIKIASSPQQQRSFAPSSDLRAHHKDSGDEGRDPDLGRREKLYNSLTWNMHDRIVNARNQKMQYLCQYEAKVHAGKVEPWNIRSMGNNSKSHELQSLHQYPLKSIHQYPLMRKDNYPFHCDTASGRNDHEDEEMIFGDLE